MKEPDAIESEQSQFAPYSDMVYLYFHEYTIDFEFFQQVPPQGKKNVNPICLGRIVMSPQHTKFFHKYLGDVIREDQEKFGEIPLKK